MEAYNDLTDPRRPRPLAAVAGLAVAAAGVTGLLVDSPLELLLAGRRVFSSHNKLIRGAIFTPFLLETNCILRYQLF
jgi:hypothetical protein